MKKDKPIKQRGRKPSKPLKMKQQDAHLERALNKNHKREKQKLEVVEGGKSPRRRLGRMIALIAVCVIAVAVLMVNSAAPTGLVELMKVTMARFGEGDGFPAEIVGGVPQTMVNNNGELTVLTDTVLIDFNSKGKEIYNRLHGFAKPSIKTSAMRTLVFDRSAKQYKIETAAETVYSGETDSAIVTGDISNSGVYALATEGDNNVCTVTVYNKYNTPFYRYNSSRYYVTGVALSDDGKKMAVATLTSENAEFKSTLLVYDFSKKDAIAKQELSGETVLSLKFENERTVTAVTNDRWISYSVSDNKISEFNFGTDKLAGFYTASNSNTVLCLSSETTSADVRVVVINSNGTKKSEFNFSGSINSVCMSDNRIYILSGDLYTYSVNGDKIQTDVTDVGALCVVPFDGKAAVLYASEISVYSEK